METDSPLVRYRREHSITQAALAEGLGILPPALSKWENGRVPAERVLEVEQFTGVSRHELRPDIYPIESTAA
tara:strand:+ start:1447 stop:1662 length:216 start_codon:yes stop_codon:yes gene_type:complete